MPSIRKYDVDFRLKMVKLVLVGKDSGANIARKYKVNYSSLRTWVAAYKIHGMAALERCRINHSGDFRRQVVEDVINNKLPYRQAAAKYNLSDHRVVGRWVEVYREKGALALYVKTRNNETPPALKPRELIDKQSEQDLQTENLWLRMENDYLKKAAALVRAILAKKKKRKLSTN